jgi:hypothetical protein
MMKGRKKPEKDKKNPFRPKKMPPSRAAFPFENIAIAVYFIFLVTIDLPRIL